MSRGLGVPLAVLAVGILLGGAAGQEPKKDKLDIEAIFKKLDANTDGKLSKDEFVKLAEGFKDKKRAREKLALIYTKIDPENQGLSKEQFRAYLESVRKKDAPPPQ